VGRFFGAWQVPNIWVHSYRDSDSSISDQVSVRKKIKLLNECTGNSFALFRKNVE
jgi:hypothetical protein